MNVIERSFPDECPNCKMPSAVTATPHCPSRSCPWLRCMCNAVYDKAGRFLPPPGGVS